MIIMVALTLSAFTGCGCAHIAPAPASHPNLHLPCILVVSDRPYGSQTRPQPSSSTPEAHKSKPLHLTALHVEGGHTPACQCGQDVVVHCPH